MSVGDISNREERPAYVRFEMRPIEDKPASIREGRYVAKDVAFALVTPPYSKDCVEYKVEQWLANMQRNIQDGRIPDAWAKQWKAAYEAWRNGQAVPLSGTPIKGWGVISPAQEAMLIAMQCLTVEDLAAVNDEGLRRLGMGGVELRGKAKTWLESMNNHGAVTVKMAAMEQENRTLKATLDGLMAQVESLKTMIPRQAAPVYREEDEITASDILEDDPDVVEDAPVKRRGRPPNQPRP